MSLRSRKNTCNPNNSIVHAKDRRLPIAVCFFNNKGGVGKTTLVANLSAELSLNHSRKVLLIDADPQCNLTQYVLEDDEFIDIYENQDTMATIYSVIHPLSIGKGYKENLPIKHTKHFGSDIVVGDPRLALKEDLLAQDWRDAKAGGTRGLRTTFVFYDLIEKAIGYDFVFFDMGPSLGAINRAILLAVNYFVVPMSIDIFSIWAIKNIGEAVKVWQKDFEFGIKNAEDPGEIPAEYTKKLRFIGYVTQQHKERTQKGSRRIVEAYDVISKKLPEEIEDKLSGLYSPKIINPHLGDIKHLASLAPKSQTLHSPMISVSAKGSYTITRSQARKIYKGIAEKFLANIEKIATAASP
jgi:cellulose biosynthesis protein BcsQ